MGLREGATENTTVLRELLEDLARRGLDFSAPRLYVLDRAKALSAAVKRHAGEAAVVQRCQVHKRRNVLDQLPEEYQPGIERKLIAAYAMTAEADARRALDQIHGELERINPSAARSLGEGMEETLTVHKLRPPRRELRNVMRARGRKSQRSSGHPPLKMHTGAQCGKISSKHRAGCLSPRASGSLLRGHMQLRLLVPIFLQRSLLLVLCISLNTCQSHKANSGPSIEFTPKVDEKESTRSLDGSETLDQSSRLLFMRTAGHGGCSPGRLTSDRDGDRWCRART